MVAADWSDAEHRWTSRSPATARRAPITASFLLACSGYYNYDEGYTPSSPGCRDFEGTIVHPQHWPEDLDYAGKKIVVIGSGATAVTLIPALANSGAGHVTMLQRSPTYIGALPAVDPLAERANKLLPAGRRTWSTAGRPSLQHRAVPAVATLPELHAQHPADHGRHRLPEGFDVDKHFGPSYNPWDQRLCLAPNGDLFRAIRKGKADVVTDTIDHFTETGIKLQSGDELRRRHHRHCNGFEHAAVRRRAGVAQRRADRHRRHRWPTRA